MPINNSPMAAPGRLNFTGGDDGIEQTSSCFPPVSRKLRHENKVATKVVLGGFVSLR
jgi:hypothetical protein